MYWSRDLVGLSVTIVLHTSSKSMCMFACLMYMHVFSSFARNLSIFSNDLKDAASHEKQTPTHRGQNRQVFNALYAQETTKKMHWTREPAPLMCYLYLHEVKDGKENALAHSGSNRILCNSIATRVPRRRQSGYGTATGKL